MKYTAFCIESASMELTSKQALNQLVWNSQVSKHAWQSHSKHMSTQQAYEHTASIWAHSKHMSTRQAYEHTASTHFDEQPHTTSTTMFSCCIPISLHNGNNQTHS